MEMEDHAYTKPSTAPVHYEAGREAQQYQLREYAPIGLEDYVELVRRYAPEMLVQLSTATKDDALWAKVQDRARSVFCKGARRCSAANRPGYPLSCAFQKWAMDNLRLLGLSNLGRSAVARCRHAFSLNDLISLIEDVNQVNM